MQKARAEREGLFACEARTFWPCYSTQFYVRGPQIRQEGNYFFIIARGQLYLGDYEGPKHINFIYIYLSFYLFINPTSPKFTCISPHTSTLSYFTAFFKFLNFSPTEAATLH